MPRKRKPAKRSPTKRRPVNNHDLCVDQSCSDPKPPAVRGPMTAHQRAVALRDEMAAYFSSPSGFTEAVATQLTADHFSAALKDRDAQWRKALDDSCDSCRQAAAGNGTWYGCTTGDCPLRALVEVKAEPLHDVRDQRIELLEIALGDLLRVIATDELLPESISYMKQARHAMKGHEPWVARDVMKACTVEGCLRPAAKYGLCDRHFKQSEYE